MVTEHRILVSDDVWAQLEAKALAEGSPVDQLVEDPLRDGFGMARAGIVQIDISPAIFGETFGGIA